MAEVEAPIVLDDDLYVRLEYANGRITLIKHRGATIDISELEAALVRSYPAVDLSGVEWRDGIDEYVVSRTGKSKKGRPISELPVITSNDSLRTAIQHLRESENAGKRHLWVNLPILVTRNGVYLHL